jgi:hypothetical protein
MQLQLPDGSCFTPNYDVSTKFNNFWEPLEINDLISTFRAKVPGGWLVMQKMLAPNNRDLSQLGNTTFIADPFHQWTMKTEFNDAT